MASSGDWQEIERLFFAALEIPAPERPAFLAAACAHRDDLRRRLEALLAASGAEEDVIEKVIGRAAIGDAADVSGGDPGLAHVGPYRLVQRLGEGGMGTVYLGERDDGAYRQQVAIKVVKEELLGLSLRQRMHTERQILAQLDHPGIARLLDGGMTPDGRPYLVMEYIEGEAIDAYCDRLRLSVADRLELFRAVCAAVEDAHGRLVVHRDIKPANVMVTAEGRPKLLDFGIAKLLDAEASGPGLTTVGQRVLTPAYASPEQLRDEPITTAVDVYGLGVLLFRLLTGRSPYRVPDGSGEALRRAICEEEPEYPSTLVKRGAEDEGAIDQAAARGVTIGQLGRQLSGDLDHIVAKALRKEPRERYGSVERLSEDIGRHLDGLPVEARRGNRRYRASRFLSRHRTALVSVLAAGGAVLAALSVGLLGQMREAERANREATASAQVVDFLVELFSASDPYKTREVVTAREILDLGVARIEQDLADRPMVQAKLMSTMGEVYHTRGSFKEADPLLRGALERWLQSPAGNHPEVATAHLDLADNLRVLGREKEALPHYARALVLRREYFGHEALEVAEVRNNHALALIRLADYSAAEAHLRAALAIRRRSPDARYPVAQSLHNLTLIALRKGDYQAAEDRARETLTFKADVLPADHPSTGRTHLLLARAVCELGDLAGAVYAFESALAILRPAFGADHLDVLGAEGDLAYVRYRQGDETAEAEQRRVLAAKRAKLGADHLEVALSLEALADQLGDRGDIEGAEDMLREALALRLAQQGDEHPGVAGTRLALGDLLRAAARLDEAEPLLRRALGARQRALVADHPAIGHSLVSLAELLVDRDHCAEATPMAEEALGILEPGLLESDQWIRDARVVLESCRRSPSAPTPSAAVRPRHRTLSAALLRSRTAG